METSKKTAIFELKIGIYKQLGFPQLKKIIKDILAIETGSGAKFANDYMKGTDTISDTLLGIALKDDQAAKRRCTALAGVFNQLIIWEARINTEVGTALTSVSGDYGVENFDVGAIKSRILEIVIPILKREMAKNGDWFGMVGVLLKDYNQFIPAEVLRTFNAGTSAPPGAISRSSGRRRSGRRSHKRRRHR